MQKEFSSLVLSEHIREPVSPSEILPALSWYISMICTLSILFVLKNFNHLVIINFAPEVSLSKLKFKENYDL